MTTLKFTPSHEWIRHEKANEYTLGITDHAQSELTDVVYVELPKMDRQANSKEAIAVVESVKAASDIFSPMSGKVIEANSELEGDPGIINRSCYENGWIAKIQISDTEEKSNLMSAAEYKKFLEELEVEDKDEDKDKDKE